MNIRSGELSPQRKAFVDHYLADKEMNGSRAAIKAGYSKKTAGAQACNLLKNKDVRAYIDQEIERRKQRIEVTQDYVISSLVEALEIAKGNEYTIKTTMVDGVLEKQKIKHTNLNAMNKSIELLGKHLGIFTEKQEVTHTNSLEQTMQEISAENEESRKSLLPKDNIDFSTGDE